MDSPESAGHCLRGNDINKINKSGSFLLIKYINIG
jgi:hypothetical protein